MFFNRYRGAIALVVVALVVGCAARGGRDAQPSRGPTAIEIPQGVPADKKQYPPQCDASCQKVWDGMSTEERSEYLFRQIEVLDQEVEWQTRRGNAIAASAASAPQGGCKAISPKTRSTKSEVKVCNGTTAGAPAAPAASVISQPSLPPDIATLTAVSAPAFKLTDPVTDQRISRVGSYDWMWDGFGYTNGQLVYRPSFGSNKSVSMTEQVADLTKFECPRMKIAGTTEQLVIQLRAAFKPSLLWESDYHRLVAIYGGADNKNVVRDIDVRKGVENYLLQHVEALCQHAATKPIVELLRGGELIGAAATLNAFVRKDTAAPFDIMVHTTRVVVPQAFVDGLALKYLSASK